MQKLLDLLNWWNNRDSLRTLGAVRSPKWPLIRAEHLKMYPKCAVCCGSEKIEVHHKLPFHLNPDMELNLGNLISLCSKAGKECHLVFGHLGSFKSWNPDIEEDAWMWREKISERP